MSRLLLIQAVFLLGFQSFVAACGVRKQWAREFKDSTLPSEQIKRLRGILAELGMEGRLSMEKAKEIKEKRELAKELGTPSCPLHLHFLVLTCSLVEDVQNFEAAVVSGKPFRATPDSTSMSKKAQDQSVEESASEKSASESESEQPTGKPKHKVRSSVSSHIILVLRLIVIAGTQNAARSIMAFLQDQSDSD